MGRDSAGPLPERTGILPLPSDGMAIPVGPGDPDLSILVAEASADRSAHAARPTARAAPSRGSRPTPATPASPPPRSRGARAATIPAPSPTSAARPTARARAARTPAVTTSATTAAGVPFPPCASAACGMRESDAPGAGLGAGVGAGVVVPWGIVVVAAASAGGVVVARRRRRRRRRGGGRRAGCVAVGCVDVCAWVAVGWAAAASGDRDRGQGEGRGQREGAAAGRRRSVAGGASLPRRLRRRRAGAPHRPAR